MSTVDTRAPVRAVAPGAAVAGFTRLLGSELGLTFRRPRNLAMLGVLAAVPVLIGVVLRIMTGDAAEGGAEDILAMVAGNGLALAFASLFVLTPLLLPVSVAVVAGDAIAGEASLGTLRYLLTAPAGRTRLLAVKYVNVVIFSFAVTAVVAVSAMVTGSLLFPVGPITLLSGSTISIAEGLLRILIVIGYVGVGMAALGAISLALSTLTEAPIGAIATTVVLVVVAQVLSSIPQLSALQPYLLTSWWGSFDGVLREPMAVEEIRRGLLAFGAYILIFGSIAWARFGSRDVTS
jgi:ABC-2 type transport system permease protein